MTIISEKITIIKAAGEELGLRLRMKVSVTGFSECLEKAHIYLESYTKEGEVKESVAIKTELMEDLSNAAKEFGKKLKGKVLVKATLVE